jgi:hypothetical protein
MSCPDGDASLMAHYFDDVLIPFLPDSPCGAAMSSGRGIGLEQYRHLLPGSCLPRDLLHFPPQGEQVLGNDPRVYSTATKREKRQEKNRRKRAQRKEKTFQADLESLMGAFRPTLKVYRFGPIIEDCIEPGIHGRQRTDEGFVAPASHAHGKVPHRRRY